MSNRHRILAAAILSIPFAAPAATLCVNPGGSDNCFAKIADAIAASAGVGDTIQVGAGTYNEGNLVVDRSVDIAGAGAGVTIVDGASAGNSVFRYPGFPSFVTSTISGMTIQHGLRGIDVGGSNNVTLHHVHVTNNGPWTGAGIFNGSSVLRVDASLVDYNSATDEGSVAGCDWGGASGGGLASLCGGGWNHISNSTFANNTAGRWGGGLILNDGQQVIENTTITGNHANFNGPGLAGSALFVGGGFSDVTVRYATIANNTSAGAGGGAILGDSQVKMQASLVQHNGGGDCATGSTVVSLGYNLVSDGSCPFNALGDGANVDAQLQPLADNGGDTPTMALPATSPAVDRIPGELCGETRDQEGVARPQHFSCDVGAFERVWTTQDLGQLLVAQVAGPGLPSGIAQMAAAVLTVLAHSQGQAACRVLPNLAGNIQDAALRGRIPAPRASALVQTVNALAASIGC
jgi:hypothetical protein